ncbi:hypothetical protein EDB84DRAFT_1439189, partial [Lactarius hengduanensis]
MSNDGASTRGAGVAGFGGFGDADVDVESVAADLQVDVDDWRGGMQGVAGFRGFADADVNVESVAADRRWMWVIGEAACKGSPGFGGFTDTDVNVESVAADHRWMWMIGEAACEGVVMALSLLQGLQGVKRPLISGEDARNRQDWTYDFLRDFIMRLSWGGVVGKYRPGTEFKVQASKDDTTSVTASRRHMKWNGPMTRMTFLGLIFGVTATRQRSVDEEHVGGPTESDSRRPTRHRIPTAKAKETLAGDGVRASKTKRRAVALTSETEDNQIQPPKKRKNPKKVRAGQTDAEDVSLIEDPLKTPKGRVFARAAEDSQNGCGNKSSNSDGLRNTSIGENDASIGENDTSIGENDASIGENDVSDEKGESSDDEWQFSQLDEMANKDAKGFKKPKLRSSTGKNKKIADLLGIFKDGKHPESNVDARLCRLCKIWLTGNVSTCRTHIIRQWKTHGEPYLAGCQREDVKPNERVVSAVREPTTGSKSQEQGTLEGWTAVKVPQWSKEGLMEHIVELVVVDDQAFALVERAAFRRLVKFLRPGIKDSDIPHRASVARAVHAKARKVKEILDDLFT